MGSTEPQLVVSGSQSAPAVLAILGAAALVGAPALYVGGDGAAVTRVGGVSLGVPGALAALAAWPPARADGAPAPAAGAASAPPAPAATAAAAATAELCGWAARELLSPAAAGAAGASGAAARERLAAEVSSGRASATAPTVGDAAIAAAYCVAAGGAPAPPASEPAGAYVAALHAAPWFVAALSRLAAPSPAPASSSASAAAAAAVAASRAGAGGGAAGKAGGGGGGVGGGGGDNKKAEGGEKKGGGGGGGGGGAGKDKGGKGGSAPGSASSAPGGGAAGAAAAAALGALRSGTAPSPSDAPLMRLSVLHELSRVFTAALHAAFPAAAGLGFAAADVVVNASPAFPHHFQCNSALALFPKLRAAAPGGGGGGGGDKKAAKTAAGQAAPTVAAAAAAAAAASAPAAAPAVSPSSATAPSSPSSSSAPPPASPRAVADALMAAVAASGPHAVVGKLEASGPGYINVYLPWDFIAARLAAALLHGPAVGPAPGDRPRRVVIDYSSPNIAKEMHIGHLRSTILGDAIARILEFAGHSVSRVNHVGDWGTQFGMLIAHLKDLLASGAVADAELDASIGDLTGFYKAAKKRFDAEAPFKARAHAEVVALQAGEPGNTALWRRMVGVSAGMFAEVYSRLGVDARLALKGESFYNPLLPGLVEELRGKGLLEEEPAPDGAPGAALVLRVPGFDVPLMVRKTDGGFGYDSTDLAALRHRVVDEGGEWLIYVIDSGQALHLELVFRGGALAGWYDPAATRVEHVGFGVVLGEDGKKFKTRDGGVVRLTDVLDEARARARAAIGERIAAGASPLTTAEADAAAAVLGYGGVKYFDLRQNRTSDYAFSYDRMLSPDGDTAVYLEYAHARAASILRRAREPPHGVDARALAERLRAAAPGDALAAAFPATALAETGLAAELTRFQEVLTTFQADLMPHRVAEYAYGLAARLGEFFRDCHVLGDAVPPAARDARLLLVDAAERTLATAMRLLGIEALDKI